MRVGCWHGPQTLRCPGSGCQQIRRLSWTTRRRSSAQHGAAPQSDRCQKDAHFLSLSKNSTGPAKLSPQDSGASPSRIEIASQFTYGNPYVTDQAEMFNTKKLLLLRIDY